jgi:DNA-directed RNA polymerase specialized sigma24 family protein
VRADEGFTAFVVAHEARLLRTASLLTGDRGSAEDLVLVVLARARRRWRRLRRADAPAARVRELLVRSSLSRRRRLWRGGQVLEELPGAPVDGDPDDLDALRQALDELSPPVRAALVLRVAEHLPESDTARVLGRPAEAVRLDADRGLAAVRRVLPPSTVPPPDDADVADALQRLATLAGPPRGPGTADAAVALVRRQGSALAAWAGGALVLAVLVVAAPALVPEPGPAPDPTPVAQRPPPVASLAALPTRGSLADDEAFLAGVAALDWSTVPGRGVADAGPPPADRHVVFAGDLPGGRRWALVAADDGGQLLHVWFGGPAGADPGELDLIAAPERSGRATTVALLDTSGPTPLLVVVTRPGDGARYSPGSVRLGDGSLGRRWTELSVTGGVLAGEVPEPVYPGSEVVELVRDGSTTALRYLSRTDGSEAPDGWALAHPVDASLTADPALRERLAACLEPRGFVVRSGGDGVSYTYPTSTELRSDEELVALHAQWDAVVADCLARARTAG